MPLEELSDLELHNLLKLETKNKHDLDSIIHTTELKIDRLEDEISDLRSEVSYSESSLKELYEKIEEKEGSLFLIDSEIERRGVEGVVILTYKELEDAGQQVFSICQIVYV